MPPVAPHITAEVLPRADHMSAVLVTIMGAADALASKFADDIITELAAMLKLPAGDARIGELAKNVRLAVNTYGNEREQENWPRIKKQILALYKLNEKVVKGNRGAAHDLADKISAIPAAVKERLTLWSGQTFPTPEEFRAIETRRAAAQRLRDILGYGGTIIPSQKRPTGRRSNSWRPFLLIPPINRGRQSDKAARNLVQWLAIAYAEATRKMPPDVTHYELRGPFSKFVHRVFEVMQIPAGNVTDLLNERAVHSPDINKRVNARRRAMKKRVGPRRAMQRV